MNKFLTNLTGKCTGALKSVEDVIVKDSPQMLAGLGIAGFIGAIIWAVKVTPEAEEAIEEEGYKRAQEKIDEYTPVEEIEPESLSVPDTIKVAWKYYIPVAITALGSTACVIGSTSISCRRNAAIAAAYTLSETALSEYKEAAIETVGEKKEEAIQAKATENHMQRISALGNLEDDDFQFTSHGNTKCFDIPTATPFRSDMQSIRAAVNDINERLRDEMWISSDEFYYRMGWPKIPETSKMLGFSIDRGGLQVSYQSDLINGEPVLTIDYDITPDFKSY